MEEKPKPAVRPWFWVVSIIIVLAGGGFFTWYFLLGPGKASPATTTTTPSATTSTTKSTDDWLTYTNTAYGYSIKYPKTLSYKEDNGTRYMYFQTAEEEAALEECSKREATECSTGKQINISVDANAGTTNEDYVTKTIDEIAANRVSANTWLAGPQKTTLGGQPAYEGIMSMLFTLYNMVTKYNSHIYDLTIMCDSETLATCKAGITSDQQKMIDSFTFTK